MASDNLKKEIPDKKMTAIQRRMEKRKLMAKEKK